MVTLKHGIQISLAVAIFSIGFYLAWVIQSGRLERVKAEYATFVAQTNALGQAATEKARATELAQIKLKKETDDEYKTAIDLLVDDNKRLRNARARASYVPPAAPGARSPELACFGRSELESAVQRLDADLSRIIDGCDQERVGLDAAKGWAAALPSGD